MGVTYPLGIINRFIHSFVCFLLYCLLARCDRIISDLGSGMNYQKRGFLQLLTLLLAGKVKTLVLALSL